MSEKIQHSDSKKGEENQEEIVIIPQFITREEFEQITANFNQLVREINESVVIFNKNLELVFRKVEETENIIASRVHEIEKALRVMSRYMRNINDLYKKWFEEGENVDDEYAEETSYIG